VRIPDALGNRADMNIAEIYMPAVMAMVCGLAAGEFGHGHSLLRLARVWGPTLWPALQDSRLLNNARKVRNRFFVDGRRRRWLSRLPDDPREVSTGQDGQEGGSHAPSKRTRRQAIIHGLGLERSGATADRVDPTLAVVGVSRRMPGHASHKDSPPMTQADSVLSTPPTNTRISQSKPVDGSRRRFLAVAAFSSVAGAGSLAAAAMASLGASEAAFS